MAMYLLLVFLTLCLATTVCTKGDNHICSKFISGRLLSLEAIFYFRQHHLVLVDTEKLYYVKEEQITTTSVAVFSSPVIEIIEKTLGPIKADENVTLHTAIEIGGLLRIFYTKGNIEYWQKYDGDNHQVGKAQKALKRKYKFSVFNDGTEQDYFVATENPKIASSHPFALYPMSWTSTGWQKPPGLDLQKSTTQLYYLENTNNPSEVSIVPQSSRSRQEPKVEKSHQMLRSLPLGFLHKKSLYLVDTIQGCVFVLPDIASKGFNAKHAIVRERVNIPLEKFLQCDPVQYPDTVNLNSNRCDLQNGELTGIAALWQKGKLYFVIFGVIFIVGVSLLIGTAIASKLSGRKKNLASTNTNSDEKYFKRAPLLRRSKSESTNLVCYKSAKSAFSETSKTRCKILKRGSQMAPKSRIKAAAKSAVNVKSTETNGSVTVTITVTSQGTTSNTNQTRVVTGKMKQTATKTKSAVAKSAVASQKTAYKSKQSNAKMNKVS